MQNAEWKLDSFREGADMLKKRMSDIAGLVVHASNAMVPGRENTARLLHDLVDAALNNSGYQDQTATEFNVLIWAQHALLMMPPVVWGMGDTLTAEKPEEHPTVVNWCLLPTTTALTTSSKLVAVAKERFNPVHFEELTSKAPAKLGQVFLSERGGSSMGGLIHLVCREPGNPAVRALDTCFSNLPERPGIQYVLPIWRAEEQLDLWTSAILNWIRPERYAGLKARQPLLVRFDAAQQQVAEHFERRLIEHGIIVGRQGEHDADVELGSIDQGDAFHEDLRGLVRSDGPLKPEVYAAWVHSGVCLPRSGWERHLRVMLEAARLTK